MRPPDLWIGSEFHSEGLKSLTKTQKFWTLTLYLSQKAQGNIHYYQTPLQTEKMASITIHISSKLCIMLQ